MKLNFNYIKRTGKNKSGSPLWIAGFISINYSYNYLTETLYAAPFTRTI